MALSRILWRGPSLLDGTPVMAIVTGLQGTSSNSKTGAMAQVWILRADVDPVNASRTGEDAGICGDCPLRPSSAAKGAPRCYVNKGFGPNAVYRTYQRGKLEHSEPADIGNYLAKESRPVRLGAYGDPVAVPLEVWRELLQPGVSWTGYTHQWKQPAAQAYRSILMASVDSPQERREAIRKGWRTFRVRSAGEELRSDEITCPASKEAGHRTTCSACRLCDGRRRGDRRKTIAILDHGPSSRGTT